MIVGDFAIKNCVFYNLDKPRCKKPDGKKYRLIKGDNLKTGDICRDDNWRCPKDCSKTKNSGAPFCKKKGRGGKVCAGKKGILFFTIMLFRVLIYLSSNYNPSFFI